MQEAALREPCAEPRALLTTVIRVLVEGNQAKRVELDWQAQTEACCSRIPRNPAQSPCTNMINCLKSASGVLSVTRHCCMTHAS